MEYLAGYARRGVLAERALKVALLLLGASILLGAVYYVFFRNWPEEMQARRFLGLLQQSSYEEAYTMWGCSVAEPCRYYPYEEFLEDWGPQGPHGEVREFSLGRSYTQPNGVIVRYTVNGVEGDPLWVQRDPPQISFAPT